MTVYKLDHNNLRKLKNRLMNQICTLSALVFIAIFVTVKLISANSFSTILFIWPSLIISSIILYAGMVWIRRQICFYTTFEIELNDNRICSNNNKSMRSEICRSEIDEVIEINYEGIYVLSSISTQKFFVPKEIQNYKAVVNLLKAWFPNEIKRIISKWELLIAAFSLLLGLALAILTWGYIPNESKAIHQTYLALFWFTVVASTLITGEAGIRVYRVPRREKPIAYWVTVLVECIPFLWLSYFDLNGFLKMGTYTIAGIVLLLIIWISTTCILVVNNLRESLDKVSN